MPQRHPPARLLAAGLIALLAACGGGPANDTSAGAVVAHAADTDLTRSTLERWLLASPELPSRSVANRIIAAWMDEVLLANALKRGPALDDSITTDQVIAPDAARGEVLAFWDERRANWRGPTEAQVDSVNNLEQVRVFQEIVLKVSPDADSVALRDMMGRMSDLLRRALAPGADFGALARAVSEDSASRSRGGFLPAASNAELASLMPGNKLWSLPPGVVSTTAIRTELGFHLFRRASAIEARPYLKARLAPELARAMDTRLSDSLVAAHHVVVAADAGVRLRAMAVEPVVATGDRPLASWSGGSLSPAKARSALLMLLPDERTAMADGSDSLTGAYLRQLARREILVSVATPGGPVTPRARQALAPQYHAAIDSLRRQFGTGASAAPGEVARALVDSAVMQRRVLRVFPGALVDVLRSRYPVRVNQSAVDQLLHGTVDEWKRQHVGDSTAAGIAKPAAPPP